MYRKIGVGLANPVEEKPGWVSQAFGARLDPDAALEIDCPDIMRHTQPTEGFREVASRARQQ